MDRLRKVHCSWEGERGEKNIYDVGNYSNDRSYVDIRRERRRTGVTNLVAEDDKERRREGEQMGKVRRKYQEALGGGVCCSVG